MGIASGPRSIEPGASHDAAPIGSEPRTVTVLPGGEYQRERTSVQPRSLAVGAPGCAADSATDCVVSCCEAGHPDRSRCCGRVADP